MSDPVPMYQAGQACVTTKTAAAEYVAQAAGVSDFGTETGAGWITGYCVWRGQEGQIERQCFESQTGAAVPEARAVVLYEPTPCAQLDHETALQLLNVTPATVGAAFAWGAGVVFLLWGMGVGLSAAKRVISKV